MRIAMVSPYAIDRPGGVQDQAASLVTWLRAEGHDSWLVAPGVEGGPEGTVHLGKTVQVRSNRSVAPLRLAPGTAGAVEEAVAGADVLHIHEPFVPAVSLGALRVPGVPKVGTFHADPGRAVRAAYRVAFPWRRLARRLDAVVAVSPVAADPIRPIVGEPLLIPNTIDLDAFDPGADKDPNRIAFLGRDEPRKGLDVLLDAFTGLRRELPDAELLVMGADRRDRPGGVTFVGPVGDDVKRRELSRASVLVAPNTGGESFGLVVLEGLAAGCAVVASELPAFRFVAADAAIYATPGDSAGLRRAMHTLLVDGSARAEYQRRARERSRNFDRRRVVADYLKVYAALVDNSRE